MRPGRCVRKRLSLWLALILLLLLAMFLILLLPRSFVRGQARDAERIFEVSYLDKELSQLEILPLASEETSPEGILQFLLGALGRGEKGKEGEALLPQQVEIQTYSLTGSLLELEFNQDYEKMEACREILVRAGLVRTLLQVPGVTSIRIRVGSGELLNASGQPVGNLTWGDFLDFSDSNDDSYRYDSFILYYTDKEGESLLEETRNVYCGKNIPREYVMLEQLAKGPIMKNHYPTISEKTLINSVVISGRVAYVDFSRAFTDYALNISPEVTIASVVNTLIGGGNVDKVQISVAGEEKASLWGESLYEYFEWNQSLIG